MSFVKLLLSFAPWIAFLVIARDTVARVEIGLVAALVASVVMAVLKLHRGIIMWVGLVFFSAATIAVLGFHNMWTVRHLGVMANGALALGSWITLLIGRPFTLEYARAHTDPAKWHDPLFIRVNVLLTTVWAAVFTVNTTTGGASTSTLYELNVATGQPATGNMMSAALPWIGALSAARSAASRIGTAMEVSSVHCPSLRLKGPPPVIWLWWWGPGPLNSMVVPRASPTASPSMAPRARSRSVICALISLSPR